MEITNRWFSNRLEPPDPLKITKIISYDSFVAWETQLLFIDALLRKIVNSRINRKAVTHKKELKDFVCGLNIQITGRLESLIEAYTKSPEFYYVGSPLAGYVYFDSNSCFLSMCRFKRVRRIAEKANRYASMYILEKIDSEARALSEAGSKSQPSDSKLSNDILQKAEKRLMSHIRENGINVPFEAMTIKDILGLKVIDQGYGEKGLESAISRVDGAKVIEKEVHRGEYNAVHYVVELDVDFNTMIEKFKTKTEYKEFYRRGLPEKNLLEDFSKFIVTGAKSVQVDLIFTSLEELIESEIGRSMHENRIFEQRKKRPFESNILINMEYIIEYLFAVGMSPIVKIDEIPIKIWGRYLPDTLSYSIRQLFGMPEFSLIGV